MEEKKTTQNTNQDESSEAHETPKQEQGSRLFSMGNLGSMLSVKEQKSLLFYIAVGIILVEFAVTVGALITGIAGAEQLGGGKVQFNFPWTGYLVTVVVAPIIVILLVNLIGMGFYRAVHGEPAMSAEQFDQMPEKARNFFSLVRGAPTIILFGGIVVLGAVMYYLDGVMSLLLKLGDSVETIVIWGTCGLVIAWCLSYCARMWLMYRTRRLEADYAYRREVLERTGMVILDGKNMLGSQEGTQYIVERALPSGGQGAVVDMDALPASAATEPEVATDMDAQTVTPVSEQEPNIEAVNDADKDIVDVEIIEPVTVVEAESVAEPEVMVVEPEVMVVEPEVMVAEPAPVVEPETVVEVVAESVAEPAPVVEPEPVVEPAPVVESELAPELEIVAVPEITPEIVAENAAFEPQTVALVHIAVNAISDANDVVCESESRSEPESVQEAEPTPESAQESMFESEPTPEPAPVAHTELAEPVEIVAPVEEPNLSEDANPIEEPKLSEQVKTAEPADIPVAKPSAPQIPQAPQEPKVVAASPKPPVRRARLSKQQKRRS